MKRLAAVAAAFLTAAAQGRPAAAADFDFETGTGMRDALTAVRGRLAVRGRGPSAAPARQETAEWTVMYFINGKNNLEQYADPNLNQMESVGSTDRVHIVAEVGKLSSGVKRYRLEKDAVPARVTSPVLADLGRQDMGDWKELAAFGKWAKARYPSRKTMLVVWNHGSGWKSGDAAERSDADKGISYDDESGNHISTPDLAKALAAMGGVDVYASDACLMQMGEVAFEVARHAGVVIGSEDNEPAVEWDYSLVLGPLVASPQTTPAQLGRSVVAAFARHYQSVGQNTTQSALDAGAFREFTPLLDAWTLAVIAAGERDAVKAARGRVQGFSNADNIDLLHFVELVGAGSADAAVRSAGAALTRFTRERLLLANGVSGNAHANARGLSVYLPRGPVSPDYGTLAWSRGTAWPAFAAWVAALYEGSPQAG